MREQSVPVAEAGCNPGYRAGTKPLPSVQFHFWLTAS